MKIKVTIKTVYGEERIYPSCPIAESFCRLVGQKTLTRTDIGHIKAIGFEIEVISPVTQL